jgi:hypothetical protein
VNPPGPLSTAAAEIDEQAASNASALEHFDTFASHRAHTSALVLGRASSQQGLRLCILGAGNCYDIDIDAVAAVYREVHLVDLDRAALERARERASARARDRIVCHAPVDISGFLPQLDRWARFDVRPDELVKLVGASAPQIARGLPGPFDVVVSACVISQIQLAVFNVMSPAHPLFNAVRLVANLTHLRLLAGLTAPTGRACLITDVSSNDLYPLAQVDAAADLRPLLTTLVSSGAIIYAVGPDLLASTAREDPLLQETVEMSGPVDAWLWQNGPDRIFLVYAVEMLPRKATAVSG